MSHITKLFDPHWLSTWYWQLVGIGSREQFLASLGAGKRQEVMGYNALMKNTWARWNWWIKIW